MANSGDKFGSVIIPNCRRTASLEEKLQSYPFSSGLKVFLDHNNSSSSSTDNEYHTPPEHNSSSQNSTHDRDTEIQSARVEEEVSNLAEESTHQVFVEMPHREQGTSNNREKRKLPFSMKTRKQNSNYSKHETFISSMDRVLKMVERRSGDCEDDGGDFMETAKIRGLTLPRPRWWPKEGFEE